MVDSRKVEGLRGLQKSLGALPKATGKNKLRTVLRKRGQRIAEDYRSRVRVDQGDLRDGIGVSTKLTRRQRGLHRKQGGNATVEMFIGAPGLPQAITEEFGTADQAPHPALRPAWDAGQDELLDGFAADLWTEIRKAAARLARKAAKLKG